MEDRDLRQIDLLLARQSQQCIERPCVAFEVEDQLLPPPGIRGHCLETVFGRHLNPASMPVIVEIISTTKPTIGAITDQNGEKELPN